MFYYGNPPDIISAELIIPMIIIITVFCATSGIGVELDRFVHDSFHEMGAQTKVEAGHHVPHGQGGAHRASSEGRFILGDGERR